MSSLSKIHNTIAFAGGGSGGHILPILSLLDYIDSDESCRNRVNSVYWFGEKQGMEYDFYCQSCHNFQHISCQFISILAGKYRRETIRISRWKNFRDCFLFPIGVIQSLFWIIYCRIDTVFCKGGYVALPLVLAAWILRKKIVVHDSDTTPGITNRIASFFSSKNFSGFPGTLPHSVCVGQILSLSLLKKINNFDSRSIPDSSISVLIAGGSLGSQKLYLAVLQAITNLGKKIEGFSFTFINGKHIIQKKDLSDTKNHIVITDLIKDQSQMGWYYANADAAIVRGGTTTLAECKLFDLPLLIVPLPVTHDQAKNADFYKKKYGDQVISQHDPNFLLGIENFLLSLSIRAKHYDYKDMSNSIQKAKKVIVEELLIK